MHVNLQLHHLWFPVEKCAYTCQKKRGSCSVWVRIKMGSSANEACINVVLPLLLASMPLLLLGQVEDTETPVSSSRRVIQLEGGPERVVWVVQLSDLHFSVHHPDRALSFKKIVGSTLAMVNPALVLITGDLTDGKSKNLETMRQDKDEWIEYHVTMKDTIARSGLPEDIFYDLRGNHDKFGVPLPNGRFDFFSQYSISASLNRTGNVQSITLLKDGGKHLFVGFDSSMTIGLRGPTNLFGHPTDKMLLELDAEINQWDSQSSEPISKIVFGHFPLSFSTATESRKHLEDLLAKHAISAYICGHLHTKFGSNLQRHHVHTGRHSKVFRNYCQLNAHDMTSSNFKEQSCGLKNSSVREFWEWEMGDWKKNRIMRIIAIDQGHVSFVDFSYKSMSLPRDNGTADVPTIIVPTFPLDSRTMQRISSTVAQQCSLTSSHEAVRSLVFSASPVTSVKAKFYDSVSGNFNLIMKIKMKKDSKITDRGYFYVGDWNPQMFQDPSPSRYWLQIETMDDSGQKAYSQMRPFSVNWKAAPLLWTWKEFLVMGCRWDSLYQPLLWFILTFLLVLLLVPKSVLLFSMGDKSWFKRWALTILNCRSFSIWLFGIPLWTLIEASRVQSIWWGQMIHLLYVIFFPWFYGNVLAEGYRMGYMSHKGWTVELSELSHPQSGAGIPDAIVIVLPHLYMVVFPLLLVVSGLAAERAAYEMHYLFQLDKKQVEKMVDVTNYQDPDTLNEQVDDARPLFSELNMVKPNKLSALSNAHYAKGCTASCIHCGRWIRKALLGICLVIFWIHWKQSQALIGAYGAKAILTSPGFVWPVPILLAVAVWTTKDLRCNGNG